MSACCGTTQEKVTINKLRPYSSLRFGYRCLLSNKGDIRRGVASRGGARGEKVVDAVHIEVGVDLVLWAKEPLLRRDAAG